MSKTEQCCGNCKHGWELSDVWFNCTASVPDFIDPIDMRDNIMHRSEGTTCPCWKPKQEEVE